MSEYTRESEFMDERVSAYSMVAREHPTDEAMGVFQFASTFRRASCCVLFFVNLFWLLFTIVLGITGLNPINDHFIGKVGMHIPEDDYQQRLNAYEVAKEKADMALTVAKCAREDAADPITLVMLKGRFTFEGRGNALTKSGLETLRAREQRILGESGWKDRCLAVYKTSYPDCDIDYGTRYMTGYGNTTFATASEEGCQLPFSPVYMFEKYGDPNFEDIPGTIERIQTNNIDWLSFVDMMHKDFTASNLKSKIMVSQIYAGTPRHSVEYYVGGDDLERIDQGLSITYYTTKRREREQEHLHHWIEKNLATWLDNQFHKTPIRTLYSYSLYDPISDAVVEDLNLLIVALLFVVLYMWFYTGSLFVTACGIFQILMSFFGANLLYRYCWPHEDGLGYNFFTLFCALSLFIIMGIGADDIFVYWDTWQGSATVYFKTVAHRMSHVYAHAATAMAVTSATTILAFVSNLSSPFVGIRTFGVFSALLVFVNYCAVITFFPCVVLVYDESFKHRKYWWDPLWQLLRRVSCRCPTRSWSGLGQFEAPTDSEAPAPSTERRSIGARASSGRNLMEGRRSLDAVGRRSLDGGGRRSLDRVPSRRSLGTVRTSIAGGDYADPLPRWFRNRYAPFLIKRSKWVAGLLVAFWALFLVFASLIEVSPFRLYELLPITSNFHQFTLIKQEWRPKSSAPLRVHVLYGLDHRDPLNIHGVKIAAFEERESGRPNWDTTFDLNSIAAQMQLYSTAEELAYEPRRGLKVNTEYGINTQLEGSTTGSLEQTADGGASSALQNPYGIQSFLHALAQWENVSEVVDVAAGSYRKKDVVESSCVPCFPTFNIHPAPSTLDAGYYDTQEGDIVGGLIQNGTSDLIDDCRCNGFFPIPTSVCLHETRGSSVQTILKCQSGDENVPTQIREFVRAAATNADESWWSDFVYAIADDDGNFERMALYEIQVQSVLSRFDHDFRQGLRMAKKWDDWADDHNGDPSHPLKVLVYVETSEDWIVTSSLGPSAFGSMLLSLCLSWVLLLLSTGNFITACLAVVTIGMVCTIVIGFINIVGWGLGPLESVLIVIVVGFSIDYTVHLADSFMNSRSTTREAKVRDAVTHTGSSVLSGAVSTLTASIPMFFAQVIFFQKFGAFVFMTIALSLIYSLGFFCSLLIHFGPMGTSGSLSKYYGGLVTKMHKHMVELEKQQAAIDQDRIHIMDAIPEAEASFDTTHEKSFLGDSSQSEESKALESESVIQHPKFREPGRNAKVDMNHG
ncbi:hypothetical protein CTAYLR_009351 [Chrysophaeum taylorii]|uniref:SSD domain-containing protein n=1 Tax=Chrysophaeum taylorii TaxID=2483200 RepID=A0AAD7XPM1_9STRA|nr:hypothetical protein CTAYLR_009351 [Chrysophaeum taylorii]